SFLYHLASYDAGGEALVSCGMMEALLKVIKFLGDEQDQITFVTRAVRVVDLITNLDMAAFQAHSGLSIFIYRLECTWALTCPLTCTLTCPSALTPVTVHTLFIKDVSAPELSPVPSLVPSPVHVPVSSPVSGLVFSRGPAPVSSPVLSPLPSFLSALTCVPVPSGPGHLGGVGLPVSLTCPLPVPYLSLTCPLPVPYLSLTCPLPVPYLSLTCPLPVPYLSLTCPLPVPYLSLTCPLPVPYLSLTCPLPVPYLSLTCPLPVPPAQVPATREGLGSLPNVFSALCLNARGLQSFVQCQPFERLFKVLLSPDYLPAMRRRRSSDPLGE
ncbi:HUWE1 ligase, partial [Calyptomena viridis]|nr:HUWE1 ligase [Calyptomena viridis]